MCKRFPGQILALLVSLAFCSSALAHFQLIYSPEMMYKKGGKRVLKLPFSHPGSNGHVMTMEKPEQFYVVHKGKKTDLFSNLSEILWSSAEGSGKAWEATAKLRGMGDYIYVLIPQPYYESSEDIYIQQLTRSIINVGGLPTDWDIEQGLPAEIRPLQAPYAVYAGGTFSAIVKSQGKPVPFAEVEVEYLNYVPDRQKNAFAEQPLHAYPNDNYETITIRADANGKFTFGVPKAGVWGFAALGVGPVTEHKGKVLSQDAVLWIQARSLGR